MSANAVLPPADAAPGAVFVGKVSRVNPDGTVGVTIDAYGDVHEWPPATWIAAGQAAVRGDAVLVLIDDKGGVWALPRKPAADVAVMREAPVNIADSRFGAVNGANIDAALTAALAHVGAAGGEILIPRGAYTILSPPSFKETRSITLLGEGGMTAGAAAATQVTYTGTGTRAIDARSSFGFWLRDLMLLYNQAGFGGTLVDFSHSIVQDAAYGGIERVYLGGAGVRAAGRLVDLDKAIIMRFRDMVFAGAADAVRGMAAAGSYSNVVTFDNCAFKGQTSVHCRNAAETWLFMGCTFENLVTSGGVAAGAGALSFDASVVSEGVAFVGCWFGDAGATGDWINFNGQGLTVLGCHIGAGDVGVRLSQSNIIGVAIVGNDFDGQNTAGMVLSGTGHRGYVVEANSMIGGSAPLIAWGGTFPVGSRVQDPSNAGGAFVHSSEVPVMTTTVNDGAFPFVPVNGMGPIIEDIAGVQKVCYRVGGTWRKATLT